MADLGHKLTDAELKRLELEIAGEYKTAVKDMERKLRDYLEKTEAQRQVQEKLLNAGKITQKEYSDWCFRHNMVGKRWEEMRNVLASDMHHTNEIALGIAEKKMPDIFALNGNFATYQIETSGKIDTGFTLYNHDTAQYLLGDQRQLMPKPSARKAAEIAKNPDMQWNMKKIQSAVLQGVLQGEHPNKVAERLRDVGQMNYNASVRYARTMTTSAQNAGRYEAIHRAARLGVQMTIEWMATLDSHTRHAHRQMHGQRTEVDEPFHTPDGFTIYYPADCTGRSDAPQEQIWNCRCTLLPWVKGFEGETVKSAPGMDGMSFEEWQNAKAPKTKEQEAPKTEKEPFTSNEKPVKIKESPKPIKRPENEQEILKQFDYTGKKPLEEILKQTNPHYEEAEKWKRNCQRTVVAEELCYRGYNVTAKPFSRTDPIGNQGTACWKMSSPDWWKDKDLKYVDQKGGVAKGISDAFNEWGAGSRAIVRLKWSKGGGHFVYATYDGKDVVYSDPQIGKVIDIEEKLKECTKSKWQMWVMRVDNRELSDNVVYAVENFGG